MLRHRRALAPWLALVLLAATMLHPLAATAAESGPPTRIVNGDAVHDPDAPWMVSLRNGGSHYCGGTLIHPLWVLTAAHCLFGSGGRLDDSVLSVRVGRENLNDSSDGEQIGVDRALPHPNYRDNDGTRWDIALVRLDSPSTAPVLRFVNDAETEVETVGTRATVYGYGQTGQSKPSSSQLLKTRVNVAPDDTCDGDEDTLCAGDLAAPGSTEPNNDSCNGDSGGPLIVNDPVRGIRQIGIVSYGPASCGFDDGRDDAGGYTRISAFTDFIHHPEVVGQSQSYPPSFGLLAYVMDAARVEGNTGSSTLRVRIETSRVPTPIDGTTVRLSTQAVTATVGDDYADHTNTPVDVSTGVGMLPIEVVADDVAEDDETLDVIAGTNSPIDIVRTATATIIDDDTGPTFTASGEAADVTEGQDLIVTVSLDAPARGGEEVTVTATGTPFDVATDVATFTSGSATATATLVPTNDTTRTPDREATLSLASGDVEVGASVTATILEDDPLHIVIDPVTVTEGNEAATTVTVTFSLDLPAEGGEQVRVTPDDGTATPGVDHEALDTLLAFDAGDETATVSLRVYGDLAVEGDETIAFTLSDGIGIGTDSPAEGVVTIRDDDTPQVVRRAGDDRIATALTTSTSRAPGSTVTVYLASARSFPDALVGTPLADRDGAPLLLNERTGLDPRVAAEINRVMVAGGRVRLLGGEEALGPEVAEALGRAGLNVDRIAGKDRFETAALIAAELGDVDRIFLATGRKFPDVLAAGAAAAVTNGAVLLTDGPTMPDATAAAIEAYDGELVAIGGAAAAAASAVTSRDLVGKDRYETAVLVAATFLPDATSIGITSGTNFPDALSGGVDIARLGGALLLTDPDRLPTTTRAHLTAHPATLILLYGGPLAVSDPVLQDLTNLVRTGQR